MQDGPLSMGKGICHQTWQYEFNLQDTQGRRENQLLQVGLWPPHVHPPYHQTNVEKHFFLLVWLMSHGSYVILGNTLHLSSFHYPNIKLPQIFHPMTLSSCCSISTMCPRTQDSYILTFQDHIVLKSERNLVCMANRNPSYWSCSLLLSCGEELTNHCTEGSKINASNTSKSGSISSPVCYGD